MSTIEALRAVLLIGGTLFFLVGSIGLLRLPDSYTRIHALTKVDNLGLGLVVLGMLPGAGSALIGLKLLLIWLLALTAAAINAQLLAGALHLEEVRRTGAGGESGDG